MRKQTGQALTQAIQLLGHDKLNDVEIAAQIGVNRRTLAQWKMLANVREQLM